MSNVRADGTPCWWTTTEDRVLRDLYPAQGLAAAMALLPGRTERAIRQRALSLGIRLPRKSRAGLPKVRYIDTPETDAALRKGLAGCRTPADAASLAARMQRSLSWLRRRCRELGLQAPSKPETPWLRDELALLSECAHLSAPEIVKTLRRAGYRRSVGAVALRLRRAKMDRTDPDSHTLADVAMLLGVSPQTVLVWVNGYGLRARARQPDSGEPGQRYRVHRKDLRSWLRDNPTRVNLAKVDRAWFMDLALGAAAT